MTTSAPRTERPWAPTLGRSVRLFRLFLKEQSDPDLFYSALAVDSAAQVAAYADLDGATLLDIGGGPGYFASAFRECGATYVGIDLDAPTDMTPDTYAVRGSAEALPFADASVDVAYSSNVLEHVPNPWLMADEMVRVAKPGGIVFLSFTPWFSPWGGHETAPWHFLGGRYAADRYARMHGKRPKNDYGVGLFGYRVGQALRWARRHPDIEVLAELPRYHPRWAWWLVKVPVVREIALWNLVIVARRCP